MEINRNRYPSRIIYLGPSSLLHERINQCSVSLYAEETTLYHASKDSVELKNSLEPSLGEVASWVDCNGSKMNVKKTQLMFLGRNCRKDEVEHGSIIHRDVS